ncbi:hypothetical protein [Campylobacter hominis]|uniref:Uncharacterized protein n=1 Tax=Campylobacter hominis (strain ATCC BAA-381 / DSM 21671 / CCUG 45161 / LMG 19568 / NCTC 13146 / CH001A) TaxID=360107 RepID=A7I054_CAMHC|nr:hypothetical protein [Campylobacter hominis]ABS51885.1 hypothetical protein CHAB381_0292 [Campylobacter hominis ATCC BAA-381]UAK85253.1 hypothetical protein K8O82_05110 [Campylobacter hominis]
MQSYRNFLISFKKLSHAGDPILVYCQNETCANNAIVMPPIQDITPTATDVTAAPIKYF